MTIRMASVPKSRNESCWSSYEPEIWIVTSPGLERFRHAYRKEVPVVKDDIVMYKEIHKTVAFLKRTQIDY